MRRLYVVIVLSLVSMSIGSVAQEHKHKSAKQEDAAATKKAAEPEESDAMKRCEGMEKMGESKGAMPMKSGMTSGMKAKLMVKMKEKK